VLLSFILLLSFSSGVAALIYEIVWFQILELVVGSSAVSLAVLLATFMGGTCLGSLLLPRIVPARYEPMKVYAVIELGIAVLAILVLLVTPFIGGVGFRGIVAAICLLPPTLLMGATLPALAREVEAGADGASWLGFFYAANIAGAMLGCLLAGFYLLRKYDVATATYVAGAVNAAGAAVALTLRSRADSPPDIGGVAAPLRKRCEATAAVQTGWSGLPTSFGMRSLEEVPSLTTPSAPSKEASQHLIDVASTPPMSGGEWRAQFIHTFIESPRLWGIYLAIGLSGFCAMAAEVIWTRLLGLLFGASVYTLSLVVAVFLLGLGIGSGIGSLLSRIVFRPRLALAWCQFLAAAAIAWTAYSVGASLPYWPVNPSISSNIWFNFQLDLDRALWAVLPPTILWGASFSFALAAIAPRHKDSGKLMGGIYAANTMGAIAGAGGASLLLIGWAGSQRAEQLLIAVSAAAATLLLLPRLRWVVPAVLVTVVLVQTVPPIAPLLVAYGRYAPTWVGKGDIIYSREGLNSSVAVSEFAGGVRTFHVAGKTQASNVPRDMRLQRMLGHLTSLMPANARSVLVIGCGAGITAGAVSVDPRVERLVIAEIEPLVPQVASAYFGKENFDVIHNSKVEVHIDDGRHYLLMTNERFDAITADPLDPWVKGAANLYTREFFNAVKEHLNPGGVVTVYIQLFETNSDAVKSALATFFDVFPNGTVWGNTYEGHGHDMVLLGQTDPLRIDPDEMDERLRRPEYARVAQSLDEVGMRSAADLFSNYAARGSELSEWLKGAAINRDRNLRMQYLAGTGLNLDESSAIYADMLAHRHIDER
jgi:spermidine synthase